MPGFKVKVLADSVSPDGVRLTTIAYQAPRVVLAELNTHRALSRNAESSRAIPFTKKLALTIDSPYFPDDLPDGELLGESKGMQATTPIDPQRKAEGQRKYRDLAADVAKGASEIANAGFHKQDVNRLLEPWGWTRGVVSATNWANFFALRCDHRAYPPFRFLARCIYVALSRSAPRELRWGDWHLPFVGGLDTGEAIDRGRTAAVEFGPAPLGFGSWAECLLARWSAARCARVSLYEFGRRVLDWDKDDATYNKLVGAFPIHASPLENVAICAKAGSVQRGFPLSNFRAPWVQLRKFITGENIVEHTPTAADITSWNVPDAVFDGDPHDW